MINYRPEKEMLTIEEIKSKIRHLEISIRNCFSPFYKNRLRRLNTLRSYLK
jgi:hypothetical protein